MSAKRRFALRTTASILIAFASYLTVSGPVPTWYSPFSFPVLFSTLWLSGIKPLWVVFLINGTIFGGFFLFWSFSFRQTTRPTTVVIAVVLILASAAWHGSAWHSGQRPHLLLCTAVYSGLLILLVGFLYIKNLKQPQFANVLLQHWVIFLWFVWTSFPWFGEV